MDTLLNLCMPLIGGSVWVPRLFSLVLLVLLIVAVIDSFRGGPPPPPPAVKV